VAKATTSAVTYLTRDRKAIRLKLNGSGLPQCVGMSLDEDERLRSDAEVERFLRSFAPGS
jgi:hypothetical protein